MKRIAIVGTSKLTGKEVDAAKEIIEDIIKTNSDFMIISGGATGIDFVAEQKAKDFAIKTLIYAPKEQSWEFFKKRNLKIAIECDELYCISTKVKTKQCYHHDNPQDHERTGGCYTMQKALKMGKKVRFFKV